MNALELRQERAALVREMVTLSQSNEPNDVSRWKQLDAKQEGMRVTIEQTERASALNTEMNTVRDAERPNVGDDMGGYETHTLTPNQQARSTPQYKRDFENWCHTGERSSEMRAMGAATGADGAVMVPQGFEQDLNVKLKSFAGLRQAARIITTATGNPLPWPREDDTANSGEFLAEAAPTNLADPTFDSVLLGSNLVSSKLVKVSFQLEQDSAFNISDVLMNAFSKRISRATEPTYLTGNGTGQPTGLLTALATAGNTPVLAVGAHANSNSAGDTDLNSLGSTDFSNLIDALDPDYRQGASFMANSSAWGRVRRTLDAYGRPIWNTSLQTGDPDKVYSYPYYYNQQMDGIGAGKKSLIFGDFSSYIIRDSAGLTLVRFNELFAQNYQRGYQAFVRTDGQLLQPAAFAVLIHPLS
jgi:HK97 family phage major capsid protein